MRKTYSVDDDESYARKKTDDEFWVRELLLPIRNERNYSYELEEATILVLVGWTSNATNDRIRTGIVPYLHHSKKKCSGGYHETSRKVAVHHTNRNWIIFRNGTNSTAC